VQEATFIADLLQASTGLTTTPCENGRAAMMLQSMVQTFFSSLRFGGLFGAIPART